ncbi:hypothetical protein GYMLUDRAFT_45503 [Collybiopsis luxurians FD-317 M1]|uniref:Unplaced genomic scaffold GYMLUscaffold_38, whole genome shotgun sequence n=1 Tax=Collybiopsis luxurians FD-317 M1 TaxID=944289 RepID=A0A0D0C707_9AGAR|nr:hypothetical protein GYMLUDRAFT_45503 [Collybiopsis luxurians FD-317 M1]
MTTTSSEYFPPPIADSKKLIVLRLGDGGKDLACVTVGSYQEAVNVAIHEYYSELKDVSRDRVQLRINITLLDGTSQVARLTESGFNDTLSQFKPMKLVTIYVAPKSAAATAREPPKYQETR